MSFLSVSFVIATYNSEKTLRQCLASIRKQEYPQDKIEIVIADGGSTDKTIRIAKEYNAKVVSVPADKQGPEYNRATGAHNASHTLLAFLDHDNILPYSHWLSDMTYPFLSDRTIVGVETLRYHYVRDDKLLGRYFSLFCVNDVLPFYLGKADRLSYMYDKLSEYGVFKKATIQDRGRFYRVQFATDAIPTLGSNGFLIRKDVIMKHAKSDLDNFLHIDINVDLIKKGYNQYAFVKNTIIHNTNERGIIDYFKRRRLFMVKYHFADKQQRRYSVYEKGDLLKLCMFIVISATFLKPLSDSLRGFLKIQDYAWFIHPVICFGTLLIYGYTLIECGVKYKARKYV